MVEGCGDADAELLLQQGITSLEDLAHCDVELLDPAAGHRRGGRARRSSKRAGELAQQKRKQEEEAARRAPRRRPRRAGDEPGATGR